MFQAVQSRVVPYRLLHSAKKKMSNPIISSFESQNASLARLDIFFFVKEYITEIIFGHRSGEHQLPSRLPVF